MIYLTEILGESDDEAIHPRLHDLDHKGALEEIVLGRQDLARRRIRTRTVRGTECAIALPRDQRLFDGAVLMLDEERAIVVRMQPEDWLALEPVDQAAALQLGYFAGNLHWRVRFDGARLLIAIEGERQAYLARLEPMLAAGSICRCEDG